MMQKKKEEEQKQKESYRCLNPNCNSVFSRPKIIKYYMCPTCQTLLKTDTAQGNTKTKKHRLREDLKIKEAERLKAEQKAERLEAELKEAQRKVKLLKAELLEAELKMGQREAKQLEAEQEARQLKAERLEAERKAERLESELKAEQLAAERKGTENPQRVKSESPKPIAPSQAEQSAASIEEVYKSSGSECTHYFGYLGEREKGKEIPAGCLECCKSLDCMLSSYYKPEEPVKENKK